LVGRERAFPEAVLARLTQGAAAVTAEYLVLGGARMAEPAACAVILDRVSHAYPFYQSFLKNAALQGTRVVNDPFWQQASDVFVAVSVAHRLGLPVAKTLLLPNREHIEGVVEESLRNRVDPPDWAGAGRLVGFPLVMRSNRLDQAEALRLGSLPELVAAWEASGVAQVLLQEVVPAERHVRCLVIGDDVLPVPWPAPPGYDGISPAAAGPLDFDAPVARAADAARRVTQALGQQLNAVDFALRDGEPVALQPSQPVPVLDPERLGESAFDWVVERTAGLLRRLAEQAPAPRYRWDAERRLG
jgi:glutathione synthase/RimK-type ligase-like ATP-grasp enzyme